MQEDQLEQDKNLPIANISRIMKQALPINTKVSKEAKETIQECLAEFIGFITNEATEKCHKDKRKSINGDDILQAMQGLGFDTYMEPLKVYLHRYREACKNESEQTDQIQTHQQVQTNTQESAQEANQTNSE